MELDELGASELGTKEYWEKSYDREIQNYRNHGDVGEIWFDEDSQQRVVDWLLKQVPDIPKDASVVDLGCGNGMLLVALAREGYTRSRLLGVDYSPKAIELAARIAHDQELPGIRYAVVDLMDEAQCARLGPFVVVHDKGTYDAISLCPETPKEKRTQYLKSVRAMMDERSIFIITSCNWTEDELILSFDQHFVRHCTIPTPCFKFGGKVGNVVTSVVFKLK